MGNIAAVLPLLIQYGPLLIVAIKTVMTVGGGAWEDVQDKVMDADKIKLGVDNILDATGFFTDKTDEFRDEIEVVVDWLILTNVTAYNLRKKLSGEEVIKPKDYHVFTLGGKK